MFISSQAFTAAPPASARGLARIGHVLRRLTD